MGSQSRNRVVSKDDKVLLKSSPVYLTEIGSAIPFYLRAPRTTQAKIGLSAFAL